MSDTFGPPDLPPVGGPAHSGTDGPAHPGTEREQPSDPARCEISDEAATLVAILEAARQFTERAEEFAELARLHGQSVEPTPLEQVNGNKS